MGEKTDRRKTKTKAALRKAMLEIFEEKGPNGLTVSALTERADINRGTFYLHYRDGEHLLQSVKEDIFGGLLKELEHINPLELKTYAERGEPYPVSVKVLEYFERHADFFDIMLGPKGDPSLPAQIKAFMTERLYRLVFDRIPVPEGTNVPRDYLTAAMTSANLGVVLHWFETGRRLPPKEVAMIITRIMYDGPLLLTGLPLSRK